MHRCNGLHLLHLLFPVFLLHNIIRGCSSPKGYAFRIKCATYWIAVCGQIIRDWRRVGYFAKLLDGLNIGASHG